MPRYALGGRSWNEHTRIVGAPDVQLHDAHLEEVYPGAMRESSPLPGRDDNGGLIVIRLFIHGGQVRLHFLAAMQRVTGRLLAHLHPWCLW